MSPEEITEEDQANIFRIEEHLIPFHKWDTSDVPYELLKIVKAEEGPTGIALYNGYWYGVAAGQGPFLFWKSKSRLKAPMW